jgi:glycosyltransferase involved in cell wall biosynthesis
MNSPFSVILPALNEAGAIGATVDRLKTLSPCPEIIVVDDGSSDGTGDIAASRGAKVIRHPAPGGYGRSIKDGLRVATNEVIVIADADGTYPLERCSDLVSCIDRGFDMAVGARTGRYYRGSFFKMPARILLKWLVEFTAGRSIPDINSGFRAFRRSEVLAFEEDLCNGFSFTTTITLIHMLTGKFVTYIPIEYFGRVGRSKVRIVRDSLRTLQYVTEVIALYNPLKLIVLLCSVLFLLAAITVVLLPSSLGIASIFITGAFLTFALGITARLLSSLLRARRS